MSDSLENAAVLTYMQGFLPVLGFPIPTSVTVEKFKAGQSNPTYMLKCFGGPLRNELLKKIVLRKQPSGLLLKGAHAVDREAQLIQSIKNANPACALPHIYKIENDVSILGTKFFLMEFVEGRVHRDPSLPSMSPGARGTIYEGFAAALASIHDTPVDSSFMTSFAASSSSSRDSDSASFCRRQLTVWSRQYMKSSTDIRSLPEMQLLHSWLESNIPYANSPAPDLSVVHGDFRIDNVMYGNSCEVRAILDWELGGLGDAAADLAYCCLGYYLPPVGFLATFSLLGREKSTNSSSASIPKGVPTLAEFVDTYKRRRVSHANIPELDSPEWNFFLCLGLYRIASICAGVYTRALQGNASTGKEALVFKEIVPVLAQQALRLIKETKATRSAIVSYSPTEINNPSPQVIPILEKMQKFLDEFVLPREADMSKQWAAASHRWGQTDVERKAQRINKWSPDSMMEELRSEAKRRGLWNLWLTRHTVDRLKNDHPSWPWKRLLPHGFGLTHHDYAFIAMETGRSIYGAESCNCQAPDTGNMEIISLFGTKAQKEQYLLPLLDGSSKSCFGMTEPMTASSDPTQLQSNAKFNPKNKDGDPTWTLNARKWWTTNACDPRCSVCIMIAVTAGSEAPAHSRHTVFLVPFNAPGICIVRPLHVFGYDDAPSGHAEVLFKDVVLGNDSVLDKIGRGFALAQSRLGPGRLHHRCRLVGHSERALFEVVRRGTTRQAFG